MLTVKFSITYISGQHFYKSFMVEMDLAIGGLVSWLVESRLATRQISI